MAVTSGGGGARPLPSHCFYSPVPGSKTHSTPESDEPKFLQLRLIFFETPAQGNAWFLKFQNFLFLLMEAVLPP